MNTKSQPKHGHHGLVRCDRCRRLDGERLPICPDRTDQSAAMWRYCQSFEPRSAAGGRR